MDPLLSQEQARDVLQTLLSTGAEFAEIFIESRSPTVLVREEGRLDEASAGTDRGAGLRLGQGETVHTASSSATDPVSLQALARSLASALSGSPTVTPKPFRPSSAPARSIVRRPADALPLAERAAMLARADAAARAADPRIIQVTATWLDSRRRILVASSEGTFEPDETFYVTLAVQVVARDGENIRTGYEVHSETSGLEMFDARSPEDVAREAARIALLQLVASPAPSGTFTVVLSSRAGGTMIHEACGHGFEADFIEKDLSVYAGKLGEKVASDLITVVDDGTLAQKRGTNRVDDEGTPASRVVLIENGILRGYLHSLKTARKMGARPTGNGRRDSFRVPPIPRMRNTCILPGTTPPDEILASVEDGIFVADMGGGEVDIVTGNFVFHCTEAYRIRQGRIAEPLRDMTLTGRGQDILARIDRVGSDLGFGAGTCGKDGQHVPVADAQPTLRIPDIVVGGTES
jgi:TldD protein